MDFGIAVCAARRIMRSESMMSVLAVILRLWNASRAAMLEDRLTQGSLARYPSRVELLGPVLGHLLRRDDDLDPVPGLHLLHQLGHVVLDRLLGDVQRRGDLLVG